MYQKGFSLIIFILAITVISSLVVIAAFYVKNKEIEKPTQVNQTQSTMRSVPQISSSSAEENGYINWKTFTSATYNYSIMYPSDWSVSSDNTKKFDSFLPPGSAIIARTLQSYPGPGVGPGVEVSVISKPFSKPNISYVQNLETIPLDNGLVGYYYIVPGAPLPQILFDVPYNNGKNTLEFILISLGQENIDNFNKQHNTQAKDADLGAYQQMIKSFKFTKASSTVMPLSQVSGVNTWKVFNNSDLGFSVRYPQDWVVILSQASPPGWVAFYPPTSDPNLPSPNISFYVRPKTPLPTGLPINIAISGIGGNESEILNGQLGSPGSYDILLPYHSGTLDLSITEDLSLRSVLKDMISTLKFTN